jgi:hypothetical protein
MGVELQVQARGRRQRFMGKQEQTPVAEILHSTPALLAVWPLEARRQVYREPHMASPRLDHGRLGGLRRGQVEGPLERPGQALPAGQASEPLCVPLLTRSDEFFHLAGGQGLLDTAGLTPQFDWRHAAAPPTMPW